MNNIAKSLIINLNLKGFIYIKTAITLIVKNYSLIYNINDIVYPIIAKKHKTTIINIERSIRYIIKTHYLCNKKKLSLISCPSGCELIAKLVEFLRVVN